MLKTTMTVSLIAVFALTTAASASRIDNSIQKQAVSEANYFLAQTKSKDKRDARQDDRKDDRGDRKDDRQDCKDAEGVVGKDKRDCKQDGRQDRNSGD